MTPMTVGAPAYNRFGSLIRGARLAAPFDSARALSALFFVSGFPALIYQLTWQRALFRIFGVNIESVTIVVTAFMLGLGLGSLLGGVMSRRRPLPMLLLFGVIEALTAVFGLFSLRIFDGVGTIALGLPLPATAAVCLGLVLLPTLLMGATLPLLVGHLVSTAGSGGVGRPVGELYFVNALGGGAACLLATVLLFPFLGVNGSILFAVSCNLAISAGAVVIHLRGEPDRPAIKEAERAPPRPAELAFAPVLGMACLCGFVSLSYEIFFFRVISFATANSASAFSVTLGAFLIGLASGAQSAARACANGTRSGLRRVVWSLALANLIGFLFLPLLAHTAWLGQGLLGVALLLAFLVAKLWGTVLPVLAEIGIAADGKAGLRTGQLYLANIVGSAAGSVVTGFVLMNLLSLGELPIALLIGGLACTALIAWAMPLTRRMRLAVAAGALAAAIAGLVLGPSLTSDVIEALLWKRDAASHGPLARVVENRSGIIAVDRDGVVYGHGIYDGRFSTDLVHDKNGIVRPFALSLYHAAPREVLMIGLSSGSWAQAIVSNPMVEHLTVLDINPGYVELIRERPEVASLLSNPKVTIEYDDGRRWLRLHPERRFDAVVANTTYHFRANSSNLLSTEFLDLVDRHLAAGGTFLYNTTDSARAQRTACLAYPHSLRFMNHMLVSDEPLRLDFARWRQVLTSSRIDDRLVIDASREEDRDILDQLVSVLSLPPAEGRLFERCDQLLRRTAGLMPITDDNMGTEWRFAFGFE
jgi:predicted membrane-bound spermidine synthase